MNRSYQRRFKLNRDRRRRIRAANIAAGLRFDGQPRTLRRWSQLHGQTRQEQNNFHTRRWRQENLAKGLTVNGTRRRYRIWPELGSLTGYSRNKKRISLWRSRARHKKMRGKVSLLLTKKPALLLKLKEVV